MIRFMTVFISHRSILSGLIILASIAAFISPLTSVAEVFDIQYQGFSLLFDCERHGAVEFKYTIQKDKGSLSRLSSFSLDKEHELPDGCQQHSSATYKNSDLPYDRGHLVPANHLDHLKKGIKQSNYMTNILPQTKTMNRGSWKLTEEIIECYRDIEKLEVIGGVIWGYNPDDDYFIDSHGVATPDYFWKVVVGEERAIAWIVPNSHSAVRSRLDLYLTTINEIEKIIGREIDAPIRFKNTKPETSWTLPKNCNKS